MKDSSDQKEAFDQSMYENYILSIQASLDGFFFLLQDKNTFDLISSSFIPLRLSNESGLIRKLNELLPENHLSGPKYNKVNILLESRLFKAVPAHFATDKNTKYFFSLKPRELKGKTFFSTEINNQYHFMYGCNNELMDCFQAHFSTCNFIHEMVPLIRLNLQSPPSLSLLVNCLFHQNYFYLMISRGDELLFLNSFTINATSDIVYYLVSALRPFEQESREIIVSGNIDDREGKFLTLLDHFTGVRLSSPLDYGMQPGTWIELPPQKLVPLLPVILP